MSNTPLSFRDEQLEELNTRSMPWFIARSMNMRANISQAGEPAEARIKWSTAPCQWGIIQRDQLIAVRPHDGLGKRRRPTQWRQPSLSTSV
jgi:hypothetical protein